MNHSRRIRFQLAISAEEYLAYYQGSAQVVVARADDNRTIRFPASAIRKFVTHDGIFGRFEITFDENNKLKVLPFPSSLFTSIQQQMSTAGAFRSWMTAKGSILAT